MQRAAEDRNPKRLRVSDACAKSVAPVESCCPSPPPPPPQQQQQQQQLSGLAVGALGSLLSLHAQYHCDVCGKDISGAFRIKCAECFDFDLCLSCFCSGRSSSSSSSSGKQQQHENSHAYIPVGRNTFPLFSLDWTAEEELLLIEGVGKYGFGNWAEVAELISQVSLEPKTAESCEKHYFNFYLNSAAAPLPDLSQLIKSKEGKALSAAEALERQHRARSSSSSSSSSSSNLPDAEAGQCAAGAATPAALPRPAAKPSHSIVGYWPLRGDFDVEFDNDAELILADMEFKDGEPVQERQLKLQIVEIYNSKLDERIYRKNTIISRGLLDVKSIHLRDKRRTKEERDLHNLFKPLARFQADEQQERLVQLLIEERRLRQRLALLQEWRSLGLKTAGDVEVYEKEKAWREQLRLRAPDLCLAAAAPGSVHAAAAAAATAAAAAGAAAKTQAANTAKGRAGQRGAGVAAAAAAAAATPGGPQGAAPLTSIRNFAGAKLLKPEELAFCESANLPPIYFLLAKRMLVQELSVHRKVLDKPLELLVRRVGQLYDFQLNMWQFATAPQALGGTIDAPKELLGGPQGGPPGALQAAAGAPKACAEGEQQKAPLQQEGKALLLSQVVQPGVYRQLGGAVEEEELQAATAAAAVPTLGPAVAAPATTAASQQQ